MINYKLQQLILITNELEENSFEELDDYQKALNDLYETFEGYPGIKLDFDEWITNEDGEIIERSLEETIKFYEKMKYKIYDMIIFNEFKEIYYDPDDEYYKGYRRGIYDAQNVLLNMGV